jgi:hypothetical protein
MHDHDLGASRRAIDRNRHGAAREASSALRSAVAQLDMMRFASALLETDVVHCQVPREALRRS